MSGVKCPGVCRAYSGWIMLRSIKDVLKRRFPELVASIHEYGSARELRRHPLKETPYGFRLMGHGAMQDGTFEPEEVALVMEYLSTSEVFVDVGANIGFFTCLARSMGKRVVSVEPQARNLNCLYANLEANHWTDVEVFPLGLSATPGIAQLYGGGTSASLVRRWAGTSDVWHRPVPLSTLDIILGDRFVGCRMLIKVDVEGAEYELIRGAERILGMSPAPAWLLEICLNENYPEGINPHFVDIFRCFWEQGYRAWAFASGRELGKCLPPT